MTVDRLPVQITGLQFILAVVSCTATMANDAADYVSQVKPLLRDHCYSCHGSLRQEGWLRLDTAEFVRRGGDRGPGVTPCDSSSSLVLHTVNGTANFDRMPLL